MCGSKSLTDYNEEELDCITYIESDFDFTKEATKDEI